ncbi:MAG: sensor histidine kinase [Desulfobacca sp.]|uniref:sensor histidine kinase n=1 Tax=Desulfobacca sp. TaxID=2067990 RepID=UPI00404B4705
MKAQQESQVDQIGKDKQPEMSKVWEYLLQELVKQYRHAMVGRRITGIIHTLNTPLQVLLMHAELLGRKLQEEKDTLAPRLPAELLPVWENFFAYRSRKNQQLVEIADKLQILIDWLRYHALHEDQHGPQEIDLNELVEAELHGYQMEPFFKNRVSKRWQPREHLPAITGYYVDFSQSFCHLVNNALEALQEVPEPVLTIATYTADGHRILAVGDNGPGIPPAIQGDIFTPFFTTKNSPGESKAGLGLFFTQRLLAPYGGRVTFTSQPGQTWFRLILP